MTSFPLKKRRALRLLPSVILVGAAVLALKTTDLLHAAYAQAGGQVAALTNDPVPANKDYAGGDGDRTSASELDVVNSLRKRRRELDAREAQLNAQSNMIAAVEQRVDGKIAQLKQLQIQINALLGQRDEAQKAQIAALVKTYSTMKAKDAARIFNTLPDEVLVPVAHDMKADILALVLANMNPDNAKTLTVKLADRLTLPQTADAAAPALTVQVGAVAVTAAAPGSSAAMAKPMPVPVKPEKATPPKG